MRDEVQAALGARRELPEGYDDVLLDALVTRLQEEVARTVKNATPRGPLVRVSMTKQMAVVLVVLTAAVTIGACAVFGALLLVPALLASRDPAVLWLAITSMLVVGTLVITAFFPIYYG